MMGKYAESGSHTVVLPSDFRDSASMFEQMMVASDDNTMRS